jgi:hypothetical protein
MTKKQTCGDCLYCKVSAESTENKRLCFCAKAKSAKRHKERYWLGKEVCKAFESMD